LLESDLLDARLQLSVATRLPFPIAAIITTGRRGYHFRIHTGAKTEQDYVTIANEIFSIAGPLGFDTASRNPSRYSRFPGVVRLLPEHSDPNSQRQRLIYLNPQPQLEALF
jgi:hypothetical protein